MRTFQYDDLLKLDYSEIRRITASEHCFSIFANDEISTRIKKFLLNEHDFRSSQRKLSDRVKYVIGGLHGLRLPNLMPIWNRAMMDGFSVQAVESEDVCSIVFKRESF